MKWETLVGKGTVDDIDWARNWRGRLEMDIFDPFLAGDTGKNFVNAVGEETWQHLKLIPFLALSVTNLLKAGVFDKLIGILEGSEESGVQAHWQAASSTSLYLMIKSGRTNQAEDAKATSAVHNRLEALLQTPNPKDRLAHLTLLTALSPSAPSTMWKVAQDTILGLVLNLQPNVLSSVEKSPANKWCFWQGGLKRAASVGSRNIPRDNSGDFDLAARCLANLAGIEGFCHIFDIRYGDAIPRLLVFSARAALETIDKLSTNREFDGIIRNNMPRILDFIKHDDRDVRSVAAATFGDLAKYSVFQESMVSSVPVIISLFKATDTETRAASIGAVGKLAEQAAFQESMKKFVPQIIELINDNAFSVSNTAGTVVGNLAKHVVFQDPLKRSLSRVVEFFRDHGIHAQWSSTDAFRKIAEEAAFRESIKRLFPSIVQLLQDEDSFVRWNAETVIRRLASQCK
ncbi:armadillo-type protein [Mycena galericulata]|nr:armadillo-type protein [Mycena galericulata]